MTYLTRMPTRSFIVGVLRWLKRVGRFTLLNDGLVGQHGYGAAFVNRYRCAIVTTEHILAGMGQHKLQRLAISTRMLRSGFLKHRSEDPTYRHHKYHTKSANESIHVEELLYGFFSPSVSVLYLIITLTLLCPFF